MLLHRSCCEKGVVVERNVQRAAELHKKAVKQGHARSWGLGEMMKIGLHSNSLLKCKHFTFSIYFVSAESYSSL